jgi:hypothetical protein
MKARSITVAYQVSGGQKTTDLDVSRKAEISLNGKQETLDSIKPGQKAKVTFEKELQIVTKIDATGEDNDPFGKARKALVHTGNEPELVEISELNDGNSFVGCLSEDGLTIYWVRAMEGKPSFIWTAHRDNPNSLFTNKMQLFAGGGCTISSDGLEMILTNAKLDGNKGQSLFVATRDSIDKQFSRPKVITELENFWLGGPYLSSDGLILYGTLMGNTQLVYFTRDDKSSPWNSAIRTLPVGRDRSIRPFNPFVTKDGLHLLLNGEIVASQNNLLLGSRSSADKPFSNFKPIDFDNLPKLFGGKPYYVAATNELFFTRFFFENQKMTDKKGIWVVKNFKLPLDEK